MSKKPSSAVKAEKETQKVGKTFQGEEFLVPKTSAPWNLRPWTWDLEDLMGWSSLVYLLFPFTGLPRWVSVFIFVFWRLMYNMGIGYLLHLQSTNHTLVHWYKTYLRPDPKERPTVYKWTKKFLSAPRGSDYDFDKAPDALNTWFMFRAFADFVLGHDLGSYCMVLIMYWEFPAQYTLGTILMYLIGIICAVFAAWAKADAYRVIKDYAWYWGDFFFTVEQSLTFDRVFSLAPHPMYSIGYAFMYGFALLSQSYTVLYVGLFGHACQFVFLHLVENPHIEKIYAGIQETQTADDVARQRGYLRRDLIAFRNFNLFRSADLMSVIVVLQTFFLFFVPMSITQWAVVIVVWRLFHTVGLGTILNLQSTRDGMVAYYKRRGWTREDAFDSWKKIYNLSATMQWICFITAAAAVYPTSSWSESWHLCLTKHVVAIGLFTLNAWSVVSQFETIGDFGWFYGDFFITDESIPLKLSYQGVYRFLNNPDAITGFAGFYGLALLAESKLLFALAALGQMSAYAFVLIIERPHMKQKYGAAIRDKAGVAVALQKIIDAEAKPLIEKAKSLVGGSTGKLKKQN